MTSRIRFAAFTFDPASGELTRDGVKVPLQRQPSRLLALLVSKPGEVVSREEIRLALWSDGTHVDFERSLNFCVAKLRAALGDDAASPRYIETVPTRGYRFIAACGSEAAQGEVETAPRRGTWWAAAATIAALLLAGISIYAYRSATQPPKIVVVPFHNETGVPDFDRIAKGVSDAAVARLAAPERLPHLRVIGNASNLRFSFKPPDMKAIGDSLGAQYLLLGQLKKDDRRLRVVAHLIRVSDQTHLWARTIDSEALDLDRQSAMAEEIAAAVTATITR
jgi:TolB-like protein/DNA-binding winged helix-turn-helix (wHTH) protein